MAEDLRAHFHEQLDTIRTDIAAMSAGVTALVPRATEILLTGDLEGAERLIAADAEYDASAIRIEESCFSLIALQAPVAIDLRHLVASIKIIADVERSADLCANICKAARRLDRYDLDANLRSIIDKMGRQATILFREATEAYLHSDGARAAALRDMDSYLDDLQRQFIQAIVESHSRSTIDLQVAVQLAMVARFFERIGDHAVNIGDRTRYIVDGWVPEHTSAGSDHDPLTMPAPTDRGE